MELAVSKIGQKVCHCFVLHYKNIKIVNSVQVQVARTCEGVNILSNEDERENSMMMTGTTKCKNEWRSLKRNYAGRWKTDTFSPWRKDDGNEGVGEGVDEEMALTK